MQEGESRKTGVNNVSKTNQKVAVKLSWQNFLPMHDYINKEPIQKDNYSRSRTVGNNGVPSLQSKFKPGGRNQDPRGATQ